MESADAPHVPMPRRRMLTLAGAGIATVGLAACTPLKPVLPVATSKPVAPKPVAPAPTAAPKPGTAPNVVAGDPGGVVSVPGTRTSAALPILRASAVAAPGEAVPNLVGTDPVWHLARRATFGPTPALIAEIRTQGIAAWLDSQLNPASIPDAECDAYLTRYPSLPMTTMQIRAAYPRFGWDPMMELSRATIARALWSKRQLFEVMVEFWSNHFNVTSPSGEVWDLKTVEDREVLRRHALGKFSALLVASAKSSAMSRYLDNASSSVDTLNENYGRELLELHTVGVDAGYTQAEVVDSARLMTGFTVGRHGEFAYYNDWRYVGPVKVLTFSSPNGNDFGGLQVAEAYLDHLAHHPATARHLATKLARRFVADTPPATLVDKLAQVYLANDTAIAPVLRALFLSPEFAASIGQKTKRPVEDVLGTARAIGVTPAAGDRTSLNGYYYLLNGLGQAPLNWGPPNGFPDRATNWLSTGGTIGRWNAHVGVIQGWWKDGLTTPVTGALLGTTTPVDNAALVDALTVRLLGIRMADPQRAALLAFLNGISTKVVDNVKWRITETICLVLDSPNWIQR